MTQTKTVGNGVLCSFLSNSTKSHCASSPQINYHIYFHKLSSVQKKMPFILHEPYDLS